MALVPKQEFGNEEWGRGISNSFILLLPCSLQKLIKPLNVTGVHGRKMRPDCRRLIGVDPEQLGHVAFVAGACGGKFKLDQSRERDVLKLGTARP